MSRTKYVTQVTVLRCACLKNHDGAPSGTVGCGTEWLLRVKYSRKVLEKAIISCVELDESFKYWFPADDVAASVKSALATEQTTAKNWQTAFTALIAVLGLTAITAGRSTILGLTACSRELIAIGALAAIVGNLAMLLFGDVAAFGFPRIRRTNAQSALLDADLKSLKRSNSLVKDLYAASAATFVSIVGAALATGVFLFAKDSSDVTSSVSTEYPATTLTNAKLTVTLTTVALDKKSNFTTTETTSCGTVWIASIKGGKEQVTFTPNKKNDPRGTKATYPLNEVSAISSC